MKFWDTSALACLLVKQEHSPKMSSLAKADPDINAWWGSKVECASALARLEREGRLSPKEAGQAFARLGELTDHWCEIQPTSQLQEHAIRFLRVHPLRAGDAMQLAAAFSACENQPGSLEFICLDARLSQAAAKEGFRILP